MPTPLTILAIPGSLRKDSFNRHTLRAAAELAPAGMTIDTFDLEGIPLYNQDHETNLPSRVAELKSKIRAADAILFSTPEYNFSIPGVLKNAIDWASRPHGDSAWKGKPVGVIGATVGNLGTARAQYHLRQVFVTLNMFPLNQPEVMIPGATSKFDKDGTLTDQPTREHIRKFLEALADWTRRLSAK
ncbi:MAG: NAD(P)H-dependent oxidoreductase [Phycisphaerales bacterium]|nr:NAD(P)H-dependent oxidoreductase [Phycisphaerales bacterium]